MLTNVIKTPVKMFNVQILSYDVCIQHIEILTNNYFQIKVINCSFFKFITHPPKTFASMTLREIVQMTFFCR